MTKLEEARGIYDAVVTACVNTKNNGSKVILTKEQWFARTKSSAFGILNAMQLQIRAGVFDPAPLNVLKTGYSSNFTGKNYKQCFTPLIRWPTGTDPIFRVEQRLIEPRVDRRPSLVAPVVIVPVVVAPIVIIPVVVPSCWVMLVNDADGRNYYWKLDTEETTYIRPPGIGVAVGDRAEDWEVKWDPATDNEYYYNEITFVSTWYKPAILDFSHITDYLLAKLPNAGSKGNDITGATLSSSSGVHIECDQWVSGIPNNRDDKVNSGDDYEYAMRLATWALKRTRQLLPKGAFNNMKHDGSWVCFPDNAAKLNKYVDEMFMSLAYDTSDEDDYQPHDPLKQLAARFLSTMAVGGGVCSAISAVVAGLLATRARTTFGPGGIISKFVTLQVLEHNFDHSFVVMCYGDSPWIVVDPWPANAYVMPWQYCCFERYSELKPNGSRSRVVKYLELRIKRRVVEDFDRPFGVTLLAPDIRQAKSAATLAASKVTGRMQHIYHHPTNLKDGAGGYAAVVTEDDWGAGVVL